MVEIEQAISRKAEWSVARRLLVVLNANGRQLLASGMAVAVSVRIVDSPHAVKALWQRSVRVRPRTRRSQLVMCVCSNGHFLIILRIVMILLNGA